MGSKKPKNSKKPSKNNRNQRPKGGLVSISLLFYNGEKYIYECLKSVAWQTYPNIELIIIDNSSETKGQKVLTEAIESTKPPFPTKVIFNKENKGFAGGHNQAINEANGDYVLCLNQDVILDNNFVKKSIEPFSNRTKIAAVQGKVLRWNVGNLEFKNHHSQNVSYIIDTTGLIMLKNRRILNRGQGEIESGKYKEQEKIFGADGAVGIYRKKALENVKILDEYFDEDFFCYKEDVDLSWRMRLYGWHIVYNPEALAWHDRTAGDSTAISYRQIIKERLKVSKFGKYLAFKNQRLMQIKNENIVSLIKDFHRFLPKEIAAWIFVLIFEKYTWKAIKDLWKQIPKAFKKRKIISKHIKTPRKNMEKWFI